MTGREAELRMLARRGGPGRHRAGPGRPADRRGRRSARAGCWPRWPPSSAPAAWSCTRAWPRRSVRGAATAAGRGWSAPCSACPPRPARTRSSRTSSRSSGAPPRTCSPGSRCSAACSASDLPDSPLTATFDARLRKTSLEALVLQYLEARREEGLLVLVLEDAQWLDPLSQELLQAVARAAPRLPLLLLVGRRPPDAGEADPLEGLAVRELGLPELTADTSLALLRLRARGPDRARAPTTCAAACSTGWSSARRATPSTSRSCSATSSTAGTDLRTRPATRSTCRAACSAWCCSASTTCPRSRGAPQGRERRRPPLHQHAGARRPTRTSGTRTTSRATSPTSPWERWSCPSRPRGRSPSGTP